MTNRRGFSRCGYCGWYAATDPCSDCGDHGPTDEAEQTACRRETALAIMREKMSGYRLHFGSVQLRYPAKKYFLAQLSRLDDARDDARDSLSRSGWRGAPGP